MERIAPHIGKHAWTTWDMAAMQYARVIQWFVHGPTTWVVYKGTGFWSFEGPRSHAIVHFPNELNRFQRQLIQTIRAVDPECDILDEKE